MDITAVVVVGGRAEPVDALTEVGGLPMVAHAVRALLATDLVARVRLHDLGARPDELVRACAGLPVTVENADAAGLPAGVVVLHDAARPLAPAALCAAVVDAVRAGHEICVPVLPLSDTVKRVDAAGVVRGTPDRSGLRVMQTPLAARAELLRGSPGGGAAAGDPLDHVRLCLAAGRPVRTVPGDPAAFAVHSAWDLGLARLLAERATGL